MSRVSSHETKTRCIEGFFELCPTPTAFVEADASEVESVIAALGLFDNRWRCAQTANAARTPGGAGHARAMPPTILPRLYPLAQPLTYRGMRVRVVRLPAARLWR